MTGAEGLFDKRGRHKTDDEVDELERLRRENKRLKRRLEENDMLVQLLKNERIRRDVRFGKQRYGSEYMTINTFMKTIVGVLTGCASSYLFQELLIINGCIEKYLFKNKKILN